MKAKIIKEDGKTFYNIGNSYVRQHDERWDGKRTNYKRCKKCKRLVARQHLGGHAVNHHDDYERNCF